ncbi:hypothetical protein CRG98_022111 [Punica granatum]|uniref:VQ domain-containing protein n=1 Tax=Punica granatum TaxID=22663 RepID=A0A2I0JNI5_PUNGR|nr:hypothetical protein CRG98_022111 [Punica granatum]
MDSLDLPPSGKSPRRELQGPRPPPLSVRKDSHKIRKPPAAQRPPSQASLPPKQPRQPVIIYAVSPKVIHTNPSEFMALVQRLTGPSPKYAASSSSPRVDPFSHPNGAVSPAARYASLERAAKSPITKRPRRDNDIDDDVTMLEGIDMMDRVVERTAMIPGILSPGPASLQPIPATFFSPPSDPNPLGFLHDFSPAMLYNNKNFNFSEISSLLQSPTPI